VFYDEAEAIQAFQFRVQTRGDHAGERGRYDGQGSVKTSFNSVFGTNMADLQKLQSAKLLISLTRNYWQTSRNRSSSNFPTFSHSLDPQEIFSDLE